MKWVNIFFFVILFQINSSLDKIVDSILSLLSKDVAANIKSVDQYFTLIYKYALLVS